MTVILSPRGRERIDMDARAVRELLAERPDLKDAPEAVRAVDADRETWTFDDVPVDSGAFGELVGEGVVEAVGEEYRLADPGAVDRALAGEVESGEESRELDVSLPEFDRVATATLAGLLALTVVFRTSTYPAVFRDRVVYPGNDPYYYVYFVERTLTAGDWSLGELPAPMETGEPGTFVGLVAAVELTGGLGGHGVVLAWLPVLAAVTTALLVYLLACAVTDDRRIALASVLVLAVLPIHAVRAGLGFVDHHAFDYVWLTLTAWGLVAAFDLEGLGPDWATVRAVGLLGAGVAKALLGRAVLPDDLPFVTGPIGLLGSKASYELLEGCDTLLMVGTGFP
jgi:dolichyl-diphosphooligosaccharide--protein glycosyltransferase